MNGSSQVPANQDQLYIDKAGRLHGKLPCRSVARLYSLGDQELIRREWRLRSADTERRARAKRRERIKESPTHATDQEWEAMKALYDYHCLCCGRIERRPDVKLTCDHVKPLCDGGSDGIENRQPLCWDCNVAKRTRTIDYRPLWGAMQ